MRARHERIGREELEYPLIKEGLKKIGVDPNNIDLNYYSDRHNGMQAGARYEGFENPCRLFINDDIATVLDCIDFGFNKEKADRITRMSFRHEIHHLLQEDVLGVSYIKNPDHAALSAFTKFIARQPFWAAQIKKVKKQKSPTVIAAIYRNVESSADAFSIHVTNNHLDLEAQNEWWAKQAEKDPSDNDLLSDHPSDKERALIFAEAARVLKENS